MINATLDSLLQFMRKNKYEAEMQAETQQVYTVLKSEKKEFPLFLRIFDESNLLQLIVFIPSYLQSKLLNVEGPGKEIRDEISSDPEKQNAVLGDLARLLHLLNKELDLPGFGMDESAGVVFYRLMLPISKTKVDSDLLLVYIKSIEQVIQLFSPPIEAISSGQMTLNQILSKVNEME